MLVIGITFPQRMAGGAGASLVEISGKFPIPDGIKDLSVDFALLNRTLMLVETRDCDSFIVFLCTTFGELREMVEIAKMKPRANFSWNAATCPAVSLRGRWRQIM